MRKFGLFVTEPEISFKFMSFATFLRTALLYAGLVFSLFPCLAGNPRSAAGCTLQRDTVVAMRDPAGTAELPDKPKKSDDRYSVRFGIGGQPEVAGSYFNRGYASGYADYDVSYSNNLSNIYSDYRGEVKTTGIFLGEFNWNATRWINTGGVLGLCPVWASTFDAMTGDSKGCQFAMAIFLMPKVKVMWCNRPLVRVYSSASAGAVFLPGFTKSSSFVKAAGQFNLISLEIGRKWFGTFEIGAGSLYTGGQIGFGYKF